MSNPCEPSTRNPNWVQSHEPVQLESSTIPMLHKWCCSVISRDMASQRFHNEIYTSLPIISKVETHLKLANKTHLNTEATITWLSHDQCTLWALVCPVQTGQGLGLLYWVWGLPLGGRWQGSERVTDDPERVPLSTRLMGQRHPLTGWSRPDGGWRAACQPCLNERNVEGRERRGENNSSSKQSCFSVLKLGSTAVQGTPVGIVYVYKTPLD